MYMQSIYTPIIRYKLSLEYPIGTQRVLENRFSSGAM